MSIRVLSFFIFFFFFLGNTHAFKGCLKEKNSKTTLSKSLKKSCHQKNQNQSEQNHTSQECCCKSFVDKSFKGIPPELRQSFLTFKFLEKKKPKNYRNNLFRPPILFSIT